MAATNNGHLAVVGLLLGPRGRSQCGWRLRRNGVGASSQLRPPGSRTQAAPRWRSAIDTGRAREASAWARTGGGPPRSRGRAFPLWCGNRLHL